MHNNCRWNRRQLSSLLIVSLLVVTVSGCQILGRDDPAEARARYSNSFFDTFDTVVTVVGYTKSESEFQVYYGEIYERFVELHRMYDIYNNYDGLNNIKTINDNAGRQPVRVSKEIIDLILFAKRWYTLTGGKVNIAMGSVLRLWHEYRELGWDDPENAKLPPEADLVEAAKHTDIEDIVVDEEGGTVYLADSRMSLDVGAVAKGYATELVAREIAEKGFDSGMISSGGNIRAVGKPLDGVRERWGVGIQDPSKSIVSEDNLLDVIYIADSAVASSGDYQRYYIVDGITYHHIIDPETLMPADYYRAVTVLADDAGVADFMSTALFLLPYEESLLLAKNLDVEALWVFPDGNVEATEGMKSIMLSNGATGAEPK